MTFRILANTPPWVWGLLAALVALGVSQLFTRRAGMARIMILPVAMTALAVFGLLSAFGGAATMASARSSAAPAC